MRSRGERRKSKLDISAWGGLQGRSIEFACGCWHGVSPENVGVDVHHECLTNAAYAPGWMIRSSVLSFTSLGRLPKKNLSVKVAVTEIDYPKLAFLPREAISLSL